MSLFGRIVKRAFDVFNSILAILFFLIFWIIIAVVIKIQSPGPVFYKAKRVGRNGKLFTCYKFRTMCVDSGDVRLTTLSNDERVFGFGKFLRKTKLDETPQLINVLKGEMSVIGPRPEDEVNSKRVFGDAYDTILSVRPGLSSPASIYDYTHGDAFTDESEYERLFLPKKIALELYYIEHRCVIYDFGVIVRTVVVIFLTLCGKRRFRPVKELNKVESIHEEAVPV